jgi:competence protein ComEA
MLAEVALIALSGPGGSDRAVPPPPRLIVDPNTAPPAVLAALPHLGPAMIKRIVAARDRTAFQSLDDFDARVRGIGPATLASLSPFLQFKGRAAESSSARAAEPVVTTRRVELARTP